MNGFAARRLSCFTSKFNLRSREVSRQLFGSSRARVHTNGIARQPQQKAAQRNKAAAGGKRGGGNMKVTIAVEGCCHGELDKIYATLQLLEQREGKKIDLLICCGDFQAVRNLDDLETMACPPKYRAMQTFYKYYSGEKVAPFPTIFIGGNHEAANHLWELYYGGWAAPNIYFLGFAGAVRFGGLRIAGLSGIYKQHDFMRGHHESLPYTESTIRSLYHVRDFEVYRLMQMTQPVDIFLSHDWPTNIARYGNTAQLLARKSFLRAEVESGSLGSPPAAQLLAALRPAYWFSAHLHTKFAAVVQHPPLTHQQHQQQAPAASASTSGRPAGQQQAAAAAGPGPGSANGSGSGGGGSTTRFLALDKCLPGRDFLQVMELDAPGPPELHYDPEWLAVLRTTHHLTNLGFKHAPLPGMGALRAGPRPEDVEFVRQVLAARGTSRVPDNFAVTAEPYNPASGQRRGRMPQRHVRNPQTVALLEMLGLPYNLDHSDHVARGGVPAGPPAAAAGGGGAATAASGLAAASAAAATAARNGLGARPSGRAPLSLAPPGQPRPAAAPAAGPVAALPPNPEEIDLGDLDVDADEADEAGQGQGAGGQAGEGKGEGEGGSSGRGKGAEEQGAQGEGGAGDGADGVGEAGAGEGATGGGAAAADLQQQQQQQQAAAALADDPMFQSMGL
ncbi:hypothetical protein PLESTB_001000700 [Pleodorina starrii]|uniref:Lariat debranching enzyme C-terminal domain-containing protein n=1 Tax=Pleodorina starrii TaxID=330485 RepID=A0A9W6BNU8_9CHLO|nr:hypothetical protein PLESTM_001206700 [Pleodorina starrii]GLC55562.1 hypothetical protein PLESTB_001000700 [Pleodorina starrii]GLC65312.1 hypothetical protein PLESTF_000279200 [Pleodorina starrii]